MRSVPFSKEPSFAEDEKLSKTDDARTDRDQFAAFSKREVVIVLVCRVPVKGRYGQAVTWKLL